VLEALKSLSQADQETLVLAAWCQLPTIDAAEILGCSRPAYAVRLHRARNRFAAALEKRFIRRLRHRHQHPRGSAYGVGTTSKGIGPMKADTAFEILAEASPRLDDNQRELILARATSDSDDAPQVDELEPNERRRRARPFARIAIAAALLLVAGTVAGLVASTGSGNAAGAAAIRHALLHSYLKGIPSSNPTYSFTVRSVGGEALSAPMPILPSKGQYCPGTGACVQCK
jgi:hypothetical protein